MLRITTLDMTSEQLEKALDGGGAFALDEGVARRLAGQSLEGMEFDDIFDWAIDGLAAAMAADRFQLMACWESHRDDLVYEDRGAAGEGS